MHIPLKRTLVFAALIALFTAFLSATALEPKSVTRVMLNRQSYTQSVGKTFTLLASVSPIPDNTTPVNWSVDNENIVEIVTANAHYAILKLVGKGTAYVTATVDGYPGIQARCKVVSKSVEVKNFKLTPSVLRLNPGQTAKLTPAFLPSNATNKSVFYFISPGAAQPVASVSQDGTVTASSETSGYSNIKGVTYNNKVGACRVYVGSVDVTGVQISQKTAVLSVTGTLQLSAMALPANVLDPSVDWESADENIATVSDSGLVTPTGNKMGTVTIYAKAKAAGNIRATCRVKVMVVRATSLKLSGPTSVSIGETRKISAKVSPTNTTYSDVTLKSSNESVATIAADGTLHAISAGTVTITASTDKGRKVATPLVIRVRSSDEPVYRALTVVGYSNPKGPDFLPFATNNLDGVHDALAAGSLYSSVKLVPQLRDKAQLSGAINAAFGSAKDSDVSVLYLATHGYEQGYVRSQYGATIYFREILSCLKPIKGDVVIIMTSCHSGYLYSYALKALSGTAQLRRTSIFCSTSVRTSSAYVNYAKYPLLAYDHFTRALTRALGFDMIADKAVPLAADLNDDGKVTLGELQKHLAVRVPQDIADSRTNHEARYLVHGDASAPMIRVSDPELVIAERK